ncbi:hypothetical protein [Methylomicrobium sp. Wu6]|uniref:hypothetical protein n=1 Tax=Methylomicrobium sp. Wu6 TaxID=3107928 RepID=UPI002DD63956|nr:hypothetical protein [Methylomicrobium sp. Wu6]MEC4749278.1 hypothetical protein [Methylomicrobium sp. Wu6]
MHMINLTIRLATPGDADRSMIVGLGPVTVDPALQNRMIGRRLMQDLLQRASAR